jgi:hypothetical protein
MAAEDDGAVDARRMMTDVQIAGRGVRDERVLEALGATPCIKIVRTMG